LDLLRVRGSGQPRIRLIKLLVELIPLGAERDQLPPCLFVFSQRCDSRHDFIRIHLGYEIHVDHDRIIFNAGRAALIQDDEESGCIGADLVRGDIEVANHGYAFQVSGHLFEGVALRGLECQMFRIQPGVVVAHSVLAFTGHDPDLSEGRARKK
jgi:hypothetical protein